MTDNFDKVTRFEHALLAIDRQSADKILREPGASGAEHNSVDTVIAEALERIGTGWEHGTLALSQVYMASRICEELVDEFLRPADAPYDGGLRIAIGVLEDYHALGKRIVYSSLRSSGFELMDYGHGLSVADLAVRIERDRIDVMLISVLMLRSALRVRELRAMLRETGRRVKLVVGGAPFRFGDDLWREVGADAMGRNTADAIRIVRQLVQGV